MSNFNTELYKALASDSSIDEIVRSEIESCLNFLLKTELTNFLDYEPYDTNGYNTGNSRNGYYARTITTRYGDIEVQIPRDRINGIRMIWKQRSCSFIPKELPLQKSVI